MRVGTARKERGRYDMAATSAGIQQQDTASSLFPQKLTADEDSKRYCRQRKTAATEQTPQLSRLKFSFCSFCCFDLSVNVFVWNKAILVLY